MFSIPKFLASVSLGAVLSFSSAGALAKSATIGQILETSGYFKTLTTAMQLTGLDKVAMSEAKLTLLAPTDKAFEKISPESLSALLDNPDQLSQILTYHIIEGEVDLFTALNMGSATTLNSQEIEFKFQKFGFFVNDARIILPNIRVSNGIIHVIDTVLMPEAQIPEPQTILELAEADGRFSTLVEALKAAGLDQTLAGEGQFTVFAPTDEAFSLLGEDKVNSLIEMPDELKNILLYHVINGSIVSSMEATSLTEATMANGEVVRIQYDGENLFINDAKVIIRDIQASNGVIHVIDSVLISETQQPESKSIFEIASEDTRLTTLVDALRVADLDTLLSNEGSFTVFAPTNEAFQMLGKDAVSTLLSKPEELKNILLYHVIKDTIVPAEQAMLLSEVQMANDEMVQLGFAGEDLFVNGARVVVRNIRASNGIIHLIDAVLVP